MTCIRASRDKAESSAASMSLLGAGDPADQEEGSSSRKFSGFSAYALLDGGGGGPQEEEEDFGGLMVSFVRKSYLCTSTGPSTG